MPVLSQVCLSLGKEVLSCSLCSFHTIILPASAAPWRHTPPLPVVLLTPTHPVQSRTPRSSSPSLSLFPACSGPLQYPSGGPSLPRCLSVCCPCHLYHSHCHSLLLGLVITSNFTTSRTSVYPTPWPSASATF